MPQISRSCGERGTAARPHRRTREHERSAPLEGTPYPRRRRSPSPTWLVSNNRTALPAAITLDALQTALGDVIASIFWTLGNVQPALGYTDSPDTKGADFLDANVMALVAGQTVVVMNVVKARVEVDLLAVIGGLVASTILLAISAQYLLHHHDYNYATAGVDIDGTGFLHAIWLYRNHPELESEVLQVRLPNDGNLRRAGMARVRLAAGKHFEKGWGG
ncbi:hypothetical protein MKEN_00484900 [Mycena kentingensis (nom. inval.)]|nr:hypothetical protein MKEN_00484900 [Mycena kentingensis (nom. inval.)]